MSEEVKIQNDGEEAPENVVKESHPPPHTSSKERTEEAQQSAAVPKTTDSITPTPAASEDRPFDKSNRKVIIQNVYKFLDSKRVKKMAQAWFQDIQKKTGVVIEVEKIKKPPKEFWTCLTLKDESMVQPLIDYINNNEILNKNGFRLVAKAGDDENGDDRKRKPGDPDNDKMTKRQRVEEEKRTARRPVTEEEIKDAIMPLWRQSYQDQLDSKMKEMIKKSAQKIVKEIKSRFRLLQKGDGRKKITLYPWLQGSRSVDVNQIVAVPHPIRNKCEFTFGYRYLFDDNYNPDTENPAEEVVHPKVPAVGCMATGWAGGVSRPHCCDILPAEACAIVDIVDEFLSTSPLPPYDTKVHRGVWRILTIRSSRRTKECMVIIMHAPPSGGAGATADSEDYSEHFESEKQRLVSMLTKAQLDVPDQEPIKVTSIFFQEFDGLSHPNPDHPVQHAYGKPFILERLGKCTFQISPGAFFQVNTEAAELLYQLVVDKVREVSENPKDTLLFDVCCGTGTIGLTCMKEGVVGKVVGIDISEPAIEDAKKNAELNGFGVDGGSKGPARFVAARAEQVMANEIGNAKRPGLKFVAVVDPARDGLHADVVRALRSNERIGRIVYVSCNPTATLIRDAALFCAPPTKRYTGVPFRIVSATPVDLFPYTNHCEMVMTFDRLSESEMSSESKQNKASE